MPTHTKIALDAREMAHPAPLEHAIKALQQLNTTNYFYMLHRKNPIPLIDLAQEHQLNALSHEDTQGTWHILIAKDATLNLKELLNV
jgi:hypothetical protein